MEKKFAELKALVAEIHDLKAALALLEWDQQVYLPAGAENGRAAQIETLSGVIHAKSTAAKLGRLIETLEPADYPEDSTERALLVRLRRDFAKKNKVPAKLVSQLARTTAEAHAAWVRARQAAMAPSTSEASPTISRSAPEFSSSDRTPARTMG